MATNNCLPEPTTHTEPSKKQLLLMLDEVITLSEQLKLENQQLKTEWEQAFLRLEKNDYTIRTLSEQKERLENDNTKLIRKNNTFEAEKRNCPHNHQ